MKTFEEMNIEEIREAVKALDALRELQKSKLKELIDSYHSLMAVWLNETNEEVREDIWRMATKTRYEAQGVWKTIESNELCNYDDFDDFFSMY